MTLSRLRADLQIAPSPDPTNPGLFIRDQFGYTDAWLIVPSLLAQGLHFFDGVRTSKDLEAEFTRLTGQTDTTSMTRQLIDAFDTAGFLENAVFAKLKESRHRAFAESPVRKAAHAGSAYPLDPGSLHAMLQSYLDASSTHAQRGLVGIAAPHVSPGGGAQSYGAAYRMLTPDLKDRTFVILGTSHHGQQNRFGLTRKPYETPFGATSTDPELLDRLAAEPASIMEDYCHAIEHSIEFQVIFLQHLYGPHVKVLPLLCGHFGPSIYHNAKPEDDTAVQSFLSTLNKLAAEEADRLFWILGVDMAHIGARYGDQFSAHADQDQMLRVKLRDSDRIASLVAGDADTFWNKIKENQDDLRWCGSSPLYAFMRALPAARGTLQRYDQWNIDEKSVVSFAGISFTTAE